MKGILLLYKNIDGDKDVEATQCPIADIRCMHGVKKKI